MREGDWNHPSSHLNLLLMSDTTLSSELFLGGFVLNSIRYLTKDKDVQQPELAVLSLELNLSLTQVIVPDSILNSNEEKQEKHNEFSHPPIC